MKSSLIPALASLLVLAACNSQPATPEVIDANPDPMADQLANAAPVELPPAIKADKSFRCKDNSVVSVIFFQGDTQANVRVKEDAPRTMLKAPAAGEPFVAEGGWSLTGDENNFTLTQPGKGSQTCKG